MRAKKHVETMTAEVSARDAQKPSSPPKAQVINIRPPNLKVMPVEITGTAPYVQHKFSAKARQTIIATQEAGSQARKDKKREPKDFDAVYRGAMHLSEEGWHGIPAPAFRAACISACRIIGFKMTHAKLAIFVHADGYDAEDGTPLVRITKGEPQPHIAPARNDNGSIDIRARPLWQPGWAAIVRVEFDADVFSAEEVANLLDRAGRQVGIGEGRPDSRNSAGCGWGTFRVKGDK